MFVMSWIVYVLHQNSSEKKVRKNKELQKSFALVIKTHKKEIDTNYFGFLSHIIVYLFFTPSCLVSRQ